MSPEPLPRLGRAGHAAHCNLCLTALPGTQAELESTRTAVGFYCLGGLDLLGSLDTQSVQNHRPEWIEWLWQQQSAGEYGTGFVPSPFMTVEPHPETGIRTYSEYSTPHLIMTYTAILSLAILRDDFSQLDREGISKFIRSCQREDGSFASLPNDDGDSDLRQVYCAFAICSMLNDWSGMDVDLAVAYIKQCFSYEGGFGQSPYGEALGGTTYCALASLYLAPRTASSMSAPLTLSERAKTIKWLVQNQTDAGGFCGRTNKLADACYCFWCSASLHILGAGDFIDRTALSTFLSKCQFKFGGIAKEPQGRPDPYHTYMSLAALSLSPPPEADDSWKLPALDALWNVTEETAQWIRDHVPAQH